LDLDEEPTASLPPIATAAPTEVAATSGTPTASASASAPAPASTAPSESAEPTPTPTPTPMPEGVTAVQLEVPDVGVNVAVQQSASQETDTFPPQDGAYILRAGNQPGRNTNSYIFAHALNTLFKPLWNVQIGAEVLVRMSDERVLEYVVTEVRPNIPCPDPNADPALDPAAFGVEPPLALQIHDDCSEGGFWTIPTEYERLTLQTSQGYNRNWGELVIIAEPAG
ncbi:MAG: sortase domain-bontaining protein, partial [Candidatus Limnocylindria bacterium]